MNYLFDMKMLCYDIEEHCELNSISISDFCVTIGVIPSTVYRFFSETANPTMRVFVSICNVIESDPGKYFIDHV